MESGTLVEWRVRPGQEFQRGDVLALVETDKGIIDVEAFHPGTVEQLVAAPGAHLAVGAVMALLRPSGTAAPLVTPITTASSTPETRRRVSPAARARAAAAGIDLTTVHGTGPDGTITLADIDASRPDTAGGAAPAAAAHATLAQSAIARAMSRAKREIPHFYVAETIDFEPVMNWLAQRNASVALEERLLHIVPVVKALALATRDVAGFNGYFRDERFQPSAAAHIGIAVAQRSGALVVPALLNATDKPLLQLMHELSDLVQRARRGHLTSTSLASATITLSSLGDEGIEQLQPIIYPDQVAIVGVGAPVRRPWIIDERIVPRTVLHVCLAADHRVSNGRQGAKFLAAMRSRLLRPEAL